MITTLSLTENGKNIEREVKYVLRKLFESIKKNSEKHVKKECILEKE